MEPLVNATAGKIVEGATVAVLETVSAKTLTWIQTLFAEKKIDNLRANFLRYAKGIRTVKTVWQIDHPVDLFEFYYPARVVINHERRRVRTFSDFERLHNILLEGIAGQGKSILLRYLCAAEIENGERLPIFVELSKIQRGEDLLSHIRSGLTKLGLSGEAKVFESLASAGRLLLLFDAFDELDESMRVLVIRQLDEMSEMYRDLKIVVSSRPESQLRASRWFQIIQIAGLEEGEYREVIKRLVSDDVLGVQLLERIDGHHAKIAELLTTPLLVTLLVITYKQSQVIPRRMSEFYSGLFKLMLLRHDGTKPGFIRARRCLGLSDGEFERIFEAMCFRVGTDYLGRNLLRQDELHSCATQAIRERGLTFDAEKFVDDVVRITCLVLRDGEDCRFIHKSVREYYSATHIGRWPDHLVEGMYARFDSDPKGWRNFRSELRYLSEVDEYRYQRFFVLEAFTRRFGEGWSSEMPEERWLDVARNLTCLLRGQFKIDPGVNCVFRSALVPYVGFATDFVIDAIKNVSSEGYGPKPGRTIDIILDFDARRGRLLDERAISAVVNAGHLVEWFEIFSLRLAENIKEAVFEAKRVVKLTEAEESVARMFLSKTDARTERKNRIKEGGEGVIFD
jgi:hypothetical protein